MASMVCAYEGYAPITTGGDGGAVVHVTNLNDSGAGSLRDIVAGLSGSPTTIVFDVNGVICVTSEIRISKAYVTLDGSTAPGNGITLNGSYAAYGALLGVGTSSHDVIIKHIRLRNSPKESIQLWGGYNYIVDHVSISGGADGGLDVNGGINHVIFSRSIVANTQEAHRSYGAQTSFHHNLYSWNNRRQPKIFDAGPEYDFRNNLLEYWQNSGTNVVGSNGVNIINNYWGAVGPWGTSTEGFNMYNSTNVYTSGNYNAYEDVNTQGNTGSPNPEPAVTTIAAADVPANVLADVGAQPTDAIDQYYIDGGGTSPPAVSCGGGGGGGPAWSETANYYVDGIGGNDGNAGTSSAPWKTLTKAVSTATSGKKVLVWGNTTYGGALTFNNSGTSTAPITFKRDPASGPAVIDGLGTTNGTLYTTKADYVVIDGFTITNGKYGVYTYGDGADAWTIKNSRITANQIHGIYVRSGDDFSIFNNAIYLNGSGTNYGVYIFSSALNINLTQDTVYKQKQGIRYDTSCSGTITNSIVANNTVYGIYNGSSTLTVTYNDVWNNGTNYYGVSPGTGSISADPKFTDPDAGDFTLDSTSPAKNAASDGLDMGYRYNNSAL